MATVPEHFAFGNQILVVPWSYATLAATHEARSSYVERFWLPILGPSTTLLLRLIAARLEDSPDGFVLDVSDTARSLGLSERTGKGGPFVRTIGRAVDFSLVRFGAFGRLEAKTHLSQLNERQLARLPPSLQVSHQLIAG